MKVRCKQELPNKEEAERLGENYRPGQQVFHLVIGDEYVVYALRFRRGELWIDLRDEMNYLWSAPLLLFEIIDHTIPDWWEVHQLSATGDMFVGPPELFQEYFHDDLIESVPEVVAQFEDLRRRTEGDGGESSDGC